MQPAELLAAIDRLTKGRTRHRDIYGLVATINADDLDDALPDEPGYPCEALDALEAAGTIRRWGGGYVSYIDRVYEPPR